MYRSVLAGRKVLVIADDAAIAAQVRPLIPAAGGAAVLVTSRSRLSGLAGARPVSLGDLADEDALTLLDLAAGGGRVAAEPEAADGVVAACAGMPLAVRLAGAVLAARPGLTLSRLAADCGPDRVLDVLAAEDSSVRAAIGSSYDALPEPARAALSLAATAVPGEIPAWAMTELAQGDGALADRITGVGLLTPAPAELLGQRYRMHPLVRAYARERGQDHAGRSPEVLARTRDGWLHRVDRAVACLPAVPFVGRPVALAHAPLPESVVEAGRAWLDSERPNLLAAVDEGAATGDVGRALALAGRLMTYQCVTGAYVDAMRAWRAVAAAAALADDAECEATAEYYLAVAQVESHVHVGEATATLTTVLPELERAERVDLAAMGYSLLGRCASANGRHAAAIRAVRHAIRLAGTADDLARCCATAGLGLTFARIGIVHAGLEHCQQARTQARRLREPAYEAYAINALAQALIISGQYAAAINACSDGIQLARGYGSDVTAARFMLLLGRARQCDGDHKVAADSLRAAADSFKIAGLAIEEILARSMLAACNEADRDRAGAAAQVREVSQILERAGVADAETKAAAAVDACQPTRTGTCRSWQVEQADENSLK